MAAAHPLTINLTSDEQKRVEDLAHQQGYDTAADFVHALVSQAITEYDFDTQAGVLAGLREGLQQVMNGQARPISELWDALEDE